MVKVPNQFFIGTFIWVIGLYLILEETCLLVGLGVSMFVCGSLLATFTEL